MQTRTSESPGSPARTRAVCQAVGALAVLLALSPGPPRLGAHQADAVPPGVVADIDTLFARWNRSDLPGCTVGVSRGGEQIVSRAYGMANLEYGIPNRPDTIIEAGSVSKQFTAAAVLLLAQEGRLALDDPIRKYLPEVPAYETPITVRHLLTHTSGLRDWGFIQDIAGWPRSTRVYTHDDVLDIVGRQRSLNFAPGTDFSYTNSGYNLAVVLVSRVAGRSFADYTRETIFVPLGMSRTSWRDDHARIVPGRAVAYNVSERGVRTHMPFENVHGNGGLLTTTGDLLRWARNGTRGEVGGRAFVEAQRTRGRLVGGEEIVYSPGGLYVTTWKGLPEVSHSGGTAGYRAWLAHYPAQDLAVAVLCNASDAPAWGLGRRIAELFLPASPTAPATAAAPVRGAEVAGLYRDRRTHEALSVDLVDGQMRIAGLGVLTPIDRDAFAVGAGSIRLEVERGPSGTVTGARLIISGEASSFERVERGRPTAADLEAFAGRYVSDEAEVALVVAVEEGRLVIRRRPATKMALTPTYRDAFSGPIGHVRFLRDAGGSVTQLSISRERVWDLRFVKAPGPRTQP